MPGKQFRAIFVFPLSSWVSSEVLKMMNYFKSNKADFIHLCN